MIIPQDKLIKDIHFPIIQAVHEPPVKMNWWKRFKRFMSYRRKWQVKEDYIIWSPFLKHYVFIPKNFVFDGASVPKMLNSVYAPNGVLLLGACPHDFGYRYAGLVLVYPVVNLLFFKPLTKKELDAVFQDFCAMESGMQQASSVATFGLRVAGFTGWNSNRKLNLELTNDFPKLFSEKDIKNL